MLIFIDAFVHKLQDLDNLPQEDRHHILYALDNLIKAAKLKTL